MAFRIPTYEARKVQKLIIIYEHKGIAGRTNEPSPQDELNELLQNGWHVVFATPLSNSVQYIIEGIETNP